MATDNILTHKNIILNGKFLAVDPSSGSEASKAGFALYNKCKLIESGIVDVDHRLPISKRLDTLYQFLSQRYSGLDLLIVEKIRGRLAHVYLTWSVGIAVSAVSAPNLIEMNTQTWKRHTDDTYKKSDTNDAIWIGQAAIEICKETER